MAVEAGCRAADIILNEATGVILNLSVAKVKDLLDYHGRSFASPEIEMF